MCSLSFFFLIDPRPPRSAPTATLFPYTTLFRSLPPRRQEHSRQELSRAGGEGRGGGLADDHGDRHPATTRRQLAGRHRTHRRSEDHTSELQSLTRTTNPAFSLKKKKIATHINST